MQPAQVSTLGLETIHAKMQQLGLSEESVTDAIRWTRRRDQPPAHPRNSALVRDGRHP